MGCEYVASAVSALVVVLILFTLITGIALIVGTTITSEVDLVIRNLNSNITYIVLQLTSWSYYLIIIVTTIIYILLIVFCLVMRLKECSEDVPRKLLAIYDIVTHAFVRNMRGSLKVYAINVIY